MKILGEVLFIIITFYSFGFVMSFDTTQHFVHPSKYEKTFIDPAS